MRRADLLHPSIQDVCIFCAYRLSRQATTRSRAPLHSFQRAHASTSTEQRSNKSEIAARPRGGTDVCFSAGLLIALAPRSSAFQGHFEQRRGFAESQSRTTGAKGRRRSRDFKRLQLNTPSADRTNNAATPTTAEPSQSSQQQAQNKQKRSSLVLNARKKPLIKFHVQDAVDDHRYDQSPHERVLTFNKHINATPEPIKKVALPGFLAASQEKETIQQAATSWNGRLLSPTPIEYGERDEQDLGRSQASITSTDVDRSSSAAPGGSNEIEAHTNEPLQPSAASVDGQDHTQSSSDISAASESGNTSALRGSYVPQVIVRKPIVEQSITYGTPDPLPLSNEVPAPRQASAVEAQTDYKVSLVDTHDLRAQASAAPTTQQDDWQHLKPKRALESQREDSSNAVQPRVAKSPSEVKSIIDAAFEKYRKTRDEQAPQRGRDANVTQQHISPMVSLMKQTQTRNEREQPQRETRRCHRCGQPGHLARDCPMPDERATPRLGQASSSQLKDTPRGRQTKQQNHADEQAASRTDSGNTLERRNDQFSDFDEITQRTLRSRRFAEVPLKRDRPARSSREVDDDEYGFNDDIDDSVRALRETRRAEKQAKKDQARREREAAARNRDDAKPINLPDYISVSALAQALGVHYERFIARLDELGYDDVFAGKVLNAETSAMIAMEYGFDPLNANEAEKEAARDLKPAAELEDKEYLPSRPPVVTIMGHVDHGKTTILDFLRKASVAAGEAGGITQHIGAFSVTLETTGRTITFLDTPGHAAFLSMRQRGANVTDIVVLVIAADDSIKPQTLEALKHARDAKVPIIVAINKVDKPEADVERVKSDLGRHGVEIEDYGGETQVVEVSGKTGKGMDDLEEAIVSQSEILDHRADTESNVEGWVLEATTKASGRVATVLVRRGTLKVGAILVAGRTWARVRSLRNDMGKDVFEATPGIPVEVDGWRDQPTAGDEVLQADSEQRATSVVEYRQELQERRKLAEDNEAINQARQQELDRAQSETTDAESPSTQTGIIQVPFVIKADVSGSAEAVAAYIMSVSSPLIMPQVLYSAVGQINESDIELASVANGCIISFNLPSDETMKAQAAASKVKVLEHNIIYRALDEVKEVLQDKLPPVITQKVSGEAEVSAAFDIGVGGRKKLKIAGCKIRNGVVARNSRVRVMRDAVQVYDGTLSSLKNVKKDVTEMRKGTECGMAFENWEDFEIGDLVQTYQEISEKRSL